MNYLLTTNTVTIHVTPIDNGYIVSNTIRSLFVPFASDEPTRNALDKAMGDLCYSYHKDRENLQRQHHEQNEKELVVLRAQASRSAACGVALNSVGGGIL